MALKRSGSLSELDLGPEMTIGRALWSAHAFWLACLDSWQKSRGAGRVTWDGIEFDKLAHLLTVVWEALRSEGMVSFRSAYRSHAGIHGHGPAVPSKDPDRPVFALDTIHHIQTHFDIPELQLFSLRRREYRGKALYRVLPGRDGIFEPTHLSDRLPPGWNAKEMECVRQASIMVGKLEKQEIRAMGTHQSSENTLEAIEYIVFEHLFRRAIGEVHGLSSPSRGSASGATEMQTLIGEVERKARDNCLPYTRGRRKLVEAADKGNEVAAVSLRRAFAKPEDIWIEEVVAWEKVAEILGNLHAYLCWATTFVRAGGKAITPSGQKYEARGEAAHASLSATTEVAFPVVRTLGAPASVENLRGSVVELFRQLPGKTKFYRSFADAH